MVYISLELVITLTFIALLTLYFHRELLLDMNQPTDNSVPLLPRDHPMRIRTRREFHELVARHTDTIIFVGAPWCGYCHSAVVQFMEAADGLGGKAFVLEVSGKELSRLADEIGITSFPSVIKSDRDGNRSVYSGERTVTAFREYLTGEKKKVNESPPLAPTAAGTDARVELNPAADPPTETPTEALAPPSVDASSPPCADAPSGSASVLVAQNTTSAQFEILVKLRQVS